MTGRRLNIIFIFCILLISNFCSYGQTTKTIKVAQNLLIKDTLTIIPSSVLIKNVEQTVLESDNFTVENDKIYCKDEIFNMIFNDSIIITYKTLNINLGKQYFHLDSITLKNSEKAILIEYDLNKGKSRNKGILPSSIDYDGSFSRGFTLGNKQDLALNSNLNLQMSGNIGGGMKIRAAISDSNIPFQPDGTTQRLNEFDKVFIEVSKDKNSLIAGDFEVENPRGYFSRYLKKIKGIGYANSTFLKNKKEIKSSVSYAISKGKFNRFTVKSINGNQGPYKLIGASNEKYLIVLAGTEKVYIDGRLMARGQDNDYIMDYNLAEITFTPKIVITENSRIVVEFEYSDQNYLRSIEVFNTIYGDTSRNIYFNFYNEQDSKNALGLIELDSSDINILKNSESLSQNKYRSGIRPKNQISDYSEKIYYNKIYESTISDSILIYAPIEEQAKYVAYFTDIGENAGSYAIDNSLLANGRVYKWVGKNNGSYEPVIPLIAPEKKQLLSLGTNLKLSNSITLVSEISMSNLDKNRYSELNSSHNVGYAGLLGLNIKKQFNIKSKPLNFLYDAKYEILNINFNPLNPFRSTEFNRDWNISNLSKSSNEHFFTNNMLININNLNLKYSLSYLNRPTKFIGIKNDLNLKYTFKNLNFIGNVSILNSSDSLLKTQFIRPNFDLYHNFKILKSMILGFYIEEEKNDLRFKSGDTLNTRSFKYDLYKIYYNIVVSKISAFKLYSSIRTDYLPKNNVFNKSSTAYDYGITGNLKTQSSSDLQFNINFRRLTVVPDLNSNKTPESNLLGKVNHTLKTLKNSVYSISGFEFGSGQQTKVEYVFIKVAPGTGQYIWNDSNHDGLEGKDEFVIIPGVDTANYVKYLEYNNDFIRANTAFFNNNIKIDLGKLFSDKKSGFYKTLSKFSANSIFRINEKTISRGENFKIPFFSELADTSILQKNLNFLLTIYYDTGNPKFDANCGLKSNSDHLAQIGGNTTSFSDERFLNLRYNLIKKIDIYTRVTNGLKTYNSDLNNLNSYGITYYTIGEEINYNIDNSKGVRLNATYSHKVNDDNEATKADILDMKINGRLILKNNARFETTLSYVKINYAGSTNSNVEIVMLEGLKNGNNYLWGLRINKRLKSNLEMVIQYDGRKAGQSKTLHTARMEARAIF